MKGMKLTLAVAASALLLAAPAMAFHDGGVAKCEGCHTMHNSLDGAAMGGGGKQAYANGTQFQAAGYLLQGNGSTSDACLVCHQGDTDTAASSYHISTVSTNLDPAANKWPLQMGPGGDFGWLNLNTGSKHKRGHNIIAPTHNYGPDARFTTTSPGGTYPTALFNCASCHDPHGRYRYVSDGTSYGPEVLTGAPIVESSSYASGVVAANEALGVFRILGGAGYSPKSIAGAHSFTAAAPVAVAEGSYNGSELTAGGVIDQRVVVYGSNMSEWCANCHQDLYENSYVSGEAGHTHPAGNGEKLDSFIVTAYNDYIASGNPTGAKGVAGYSTLVPFETGATMANRAALEADLAAGGPTAAATSNVSCLSCHRAHASGFNSMLRYDPATFMTVDNAGTTVYSTQADANSMLTAAYYGRPASSFIAYQRALCNKCHAKD